MGGVWSIFSCSSCTGNARRRPDQLAPEHSQPVTKRRACRACASSTAGGICYPSSARAVDFFALPSPLSSPASSPSSDWRQLVREQGIQNLSRPCRCKDVEYCRGDPIMGKVGQLPVAQALVACLCLHHREVVCTRMTNPLSAEIA